MITGGSGFIGSNLAREAKKSGHSVMITRFSHPVALKGYIVERLDTRSKDECIRIARDFKIQRIS